MAKLIKIFMLLLLLIRKRRLEFSLLVENQMREIFVLSSEEYSFLQVVLLGKKNEGRE